MLNDIISTFTRMVPYRYVGESLPCNLCESSEREVVSQRDRYGNKLFTAICMNCGLVFTDPMPTEQEVATYYTRFYRRHYQRMDKPGRKLILRSIRNAHMNYEHIEAYLSPGAKILDVGSGAGELVRHLRERGYDAQGIEPNIGFANYSVQTYKIPVRQVSWQAAEIPPGSMDIVTSFHVLEHLHNPLAALRRFHQWLKPDGHAYISVPDVSDDQRTPFACFHFAHIYNFSPETLQMIALRAGFDLASRSAPRNTTVILRKLGEPVEEWQRFPDHAQAMKRFFATHSNARHFLSRTPYVRWFQRMRRLTGDLAQSSFMRAPAKS